MKTLQPSERQVQRSILEMMGVAFPRVLVIHVPNGAYLGSNEAERKRTMGMLLGDGLKPGFPDLSVYWNNGHALIEVKRPGYSPSEVSQKQREIHAQLSEMGYAPAIVTSPEEAFAFLKERGAPTNLRSWGRMAA